MSEATATATSNGSADAAEGGVAVVTEGVNDTTTTQHTEPAVVPDAAKAGAAVEVDAAGGVSGDVAENGVAAKTVEVGVAAEAGPPQPIFTCLMFVEAPHLADIVTSFREHFAPARQFNSCIGETGWVTKENAIEDSYHFAEVQVPDEKAASAWASKISCEPLEAGRPAWRVTVLRAPAPARTAVVVRVHRRVCDGFGDAGSELAALESSLGAALPPPAPKEAEQPPAKKQRRARSPSQEKKEPPKKGPGGGTTGPSAKQIAQEAMEAMDSQKRDPVLPAKAWKAAMEAASQLSAVNSNQKGGGGSALYHECRVTLYAALLDLPPGGHLEAMKERLDHMAKVFVPKTPGSYRTVSFEIEAYLKQHSK